MIEPTNACNLKCFMCDYQNQFKGARAYLSLKDYESILTQFPRINALIFCGLGESLLNKDIFNMVSIARDKKISFLNLITNGILLKKESFLKLVESGLTRIQISLHSTNARIIKKINGISEDMHNQVKNNIVNALKLKDSLCLDICVVVNSVMNVENCDDLFSLIDFCEENRVDEINFIQLTTLFGKYDGFNLTKKRAALVIKEIKSRLTNSSVKVGFLGANMAGRCCQCWNFIMIHADGTISPCNGIMPHENIRIGNLIDDNISRIWHSDKYLELRKSVMEGNLQNCRYCEVGYSLEGKNFEWVNNYYIKPLIRNLYANLRNE